MPYSQRQMRLAFARHAGKAKGSGMPKKVADEMVAEMHGHKMSALPETANPKKAASLRRRFKKS